jgi:hypothetical protein
MHQHMKAVHPELPRSYGEEEYLFQRRGQRPTNKRSSASCFDEDSNGRPSKIRRLDSPINKKMFRTLLAQFILSSNSPESMVDNPHFRELLEYLDPSVKECLISRRTLSRNLVALFYTKHEELKIELARHVRTGGMISLTLDAWTSIAQAGYLAITGHYASRISSQPTVLRSVLLTFKPMRGSHDAEALSDTILECLEELGINNHIRAITADNASSNLAAFRKLEQSGRMQSFSIQHCTVRCMAHAINLSAQDVMEEIDRDLDPIDEDALSKDEIWKASDPRQPHDDQDDFDMEAAGEAAVAKIFWVARKIISKIRKSNLLSEALEDRQRTMGLPTLKLILDVRTRWNSTHDMIKRLIENRLAVDFLCNREKALYKCNLILDDFDWKWLGILNEVLEIYKNPTTLVSGDSYPTLSV